MLNFFKNVFNVNFVIGWWNKHKVFRSILILISIIAMFLFSFFANPWIGIIILYISLFITFWGNVLTFIKLLLLLLKKWFMFLWNNRYKFKDAIKCIFVEISAFLIILVISLLIALLFLNKDSSYFHLYDPVTNNDFLSTLIALIISITSFFLISLIFHLIYAKMNKSKWGKNTINVILTLLITVLFSFILGLGTILDDYLDLYFKSQITNISNFTDYQIEQGSFDFRSDISLLVYWLLAAGISFQVTFKIAEKQNSTKYNDN